MELNIPGLKDTLESWQIEGLQRITEIETSSFRGGFQCDAPGLGKTLQFLARICMTMLKGPTLVVCSKQIIWEWIRQILGHFDSDIAFPLGWNILQCGKNKSHTESSLAKILNSSIVITSWSAVRLAYDKYVLELNTYIKNKYEENHNSEFLRSVGVSERNIADCTCHMSADLSLKSRYFDDLRRDIRGHAAIFIHIWERIVCDEGHEFKNHKTGIAISILHLKTRHPWFVSASPVNNGPKDLYSAFRFVGVYHEAYCNYRPRSWADFCKLYDEKNKDAVEFYSKLIGAIMIRRENKTRVVRRIVHVEMETEEEKSIYKSIQIAAYDRWNSNERNILGWVVRMLQACACPRIVLDAHHKKLELAELAKKAKDQEQLKRIKSIESNDPSMCVDLLPLVENLEKFDNMHVISSKFNAMLNEIEKVPQDEKIIIFIQWNIVADMLKFFINEHFPTIGILQIDGRIKEAEERSAIVERFQTTEFERILIVSLKIGSFGINLSRANHIFFSGISWNPQHDYQAEKRCDRPGQTRDVVNSVYFVVKDTIEEHTIALVTKKLEDATSYINKYGVNNYDGPSSAPVTINDIFSNRTLLTPRAQNFRTWATSRKKPPVSTNLETLTLRKTSYTLN